MGSATVSSSETASGEYDPNSKRSKSSFCKEHLPVFSGFAERPRRLYVLRFSRSQTLRELSRISMIGRKSPGFKFPARTSVISESTFTFHKRTI